jgi:hypothetical protein
LIPLANSVSFSSVSFSSSSVLRGPVDALNGFTYVLLKEYGGKLDARAKELIEQMRSSGKGMIQLIDDLLNLSRVTSSLLQSEPVDLSAIAHSVADELKRSQPERKVEFVISSLEETEADPHCSELCWRISSATPGSTLPDTNRRKLSSAPEAKMDKPFISCVTMAPDLIPGPLIACFSRSKDSIRWRSFPAMASAGRQFKESFIGTVAKSEPNPKWSTVLPSTSGWLLPVCERRIHPCVNRLASF